MLCCYVQECIQFAPSYDRTRHSVSQVEAAKDAMAQYGELGFCGLSMAFQFGGSQLPQHEAFLARLPFLVANDGGSLAPAYFQSSSSFTTLYDACCEGVYGAGADAGGVHDVPNLDKDVLFTTLASGINYGAVILPCCAQGPSHGRSAEGRSAEGYLH